MMEPERLPASPSQNGTHGCREDQHPARKSVDEWRHIVHTFRTPLTRIIKPLHFLLKSRLHCDPDGQELQEEFLEMDERNIEAAEKLLDYMLKDDGKTEQDLVARWQLFEDALKALHPILYEIIIGKCDAEIQEQQKALIDFFMEDISRCIDPAHLLPALYANELLGQAQCEHLRCLRQQKGPTLSAIFMLCNIHRINPDWYSTFLGVLMDNGYSELVQILDDDMYNKKIRQAASFMHRPSSIGSNMMEEHGGAYNPRPSNYAAPPCDVSQPRRDFTPQEKGEGERGDLLPPKRDDDEPSVGTGQQSPFSGQGTQDHEDLDSEEESDVFHSCDSSFDLEDGHDFDLTNVKEVKTLTDAAMTVSGGSTNRTGNKHMVSDDSGNREPVHAAKNELGRKNILSCDAKPSDPDNSNAEVDSPQRREEEDVQGEPLVLRAYQEELAKEGLTGNNAIVIAPTGSGKTHVALRIIQNHLEQQGTGVRKVVFLVNQQALAQQQYEECAKYLSDYRVKLVIGNAAATSTETVPLKHLLMRADVLVLTAQILVNALHQKEIDGICQFSLVVFDECHHTNLQHPFNSIMHHYMAVKYRDDEDVQVELPQVVGLTASVGVGKAGNQEQARKHIHKLCAHLDADFICTVTSNAEQLAQYSNVPKYEQHLCRKRPDDKFQTKIEDIMKIIEEKMEKSEYVEDDDADALKEKLKLKPHIRGTSQYTGWVSELMRHIQMLDNAEARRYLESSRRMLKFYNQSLVINDECDTKDALESLDLQLSEIYDPMKKRGTQIDIFLRDLFDKNKPYLDVVSDEEANTNPKLNTLEDLLVKAFREEPQSRAMVFVKTRDLAEALVQWMLRRPLLKRLRPGKMVGAGPSADRGGMTRPQQVDVMDNFRAGDHKVMVATSVAEEGLDIRKCNLVIRYDHVTNEIAMVQARGRARAENSQFVTLAGHDKGVQAKEEVNFIREMMMRDAIKELQTEIKTNHSRFRAELHQIQREEKSKRDAELSQRKGRQLRQGDVVFRCRNCDAYGFVSSDVRKINGMHRIVKDLDYRLRHIERMCAPEQFGQIQWKGKLFCKQCGEDWGPIFLYQSVKFPGIRLEGFRLTDEFDRKDIPKKWKQTNFIVEELQPGELEQYRQEAIAVEYI